MSAEDPLRDAVKQVPELCSREGAFELKRMIESYWAARGKKVYVSFIYREHCNTMRSGRYELRSNLVDGLPREDLAAQQEAA